MINDADMKISQVGSCDAKLPLVTFSPLSNTPLLLSRSSTSHIFRIPINECSYIACACLESKEENEQDILR